MDRLQMVKWNEPLSSLSYIHTNRTTAILPRQVISEIRSKGEGREKMADSSRWKATVHVAGLAPQVTLTNIHDAFIPFGEIADITLPKNDNPNSTELHRGFAYVEFEDLDDAKEAIDNMDQSELFGRTLRVSAAKPPKSANEGLGSKTAVWEQVSACFLPKAQLVRRLML
jgi:RNA recognition motif-containing protein